MLKNKKILFGITGGIAVYKACSLVNLFIKEGADVKVVMTEAAEKFVTSTTFQALTNHAVYTDMFKIINHEEVEHISLAQWVDFMVVAPATANTIGKIACGLADNLLTTVTMALAENIHVFIAPAMNTAMWNNPMTQKNIKTIKKYEKYVIIPPRTGVLACRTEGVGKIATNYEILNEIKEHLKQLK